MPISKPVEGEAVPTLKTAGDFMEVANEIESLVRTVWHAVNSPNFEETDYNGVSNVIYMALAKIEDMHSRLCALNEQDIATACQAVPQGTGKPDLQSPELQAGVRYGGPLGHHR